MQNNARVENVSQSSSVGSDSYERSAFEEEKKNEIVRNDPIIEKETIQSDCIDGKYVIVRRFGESTEPTKMVFLV